MFSIDMANVSPVPIRYWINKDFEKRPFDRDKSNFNISVLSSIHSSGLSLTRFLQIPDRSVFILSTNIIQICFQSVASLTN